MGDEHYFISAGETSGDLLGGELVRDLKVRLPHFVPCGIAGPRMREAGVLALASIEDLAVMGFVEVLKHLPRIKDLESELLARIDRLAPSFAVLIDYPGFHMRLAEQLKMRGIRVYQYVAPQLWAWGEDRVNILRQVTDGVLGIMPFEADWFKERGVNYTYVGTPQVDRVKAVERDRTRLGLPREGPVVGFFPGSRASEVKRVLPVMKAVRDAIKQLVPDVTAVVSAAPGLDDQLFQSIAATNTIVTRTRSLDLMASADVALVTSGTATLECALVGTPMAVMYVLNPISYLMARRLVRLPYISLVNLVAGKRIVNEYIQNIDTEALARHLAALITDVPTRTGLTTDLAALQARVHGGSAACAGDWIARAIQ